MSRLLRRQTGARTTKEQPSGTLSRGTTTTAMQRRLTTGAVPQTSVTMRHTTTTQEISITVNNTRNIPATRASTRVTNSVRVTPSPSARILPLRQRQPAVVTRAPRGRRTTIPVTSQAAEQPAKSSPNVQQQKGSELKKLLARVSPSTKHVATNQLNDSVFIRNTIYCPVCYNNIVKEGHKAMSTKCGHLFCDVCLKQILLNRPNCPLCQKIIEMHECRELFIN